jgi:2'-5' RNA ligase
VPAHVTLLYPFVPAEQVDAGVLGELEWFFAGVDAFEVAFDRVGEFAQDGVVFLGARGRELEQLSTALARRWPECPPYDGKVEHPLPHLTAVRSDDPELRAQACAALQDGLPLTALLAHAELWVCDDDGTWSSRASFAFGAAELL